ncbi:response regulator transcription factor [Nocardioides guangzhouensis]|uniref:Response regulator transcription factor n=1 Tax=Nocardioides guangzhouensis TaxID=2497878 RepID=A0A4Q4Z7Y8_9ACTN|nr:response regulator transcription factor [Nocardioides guangzhouensis]RYP83902.1 response regulator transcription factor [Nocardioides guangzhouensis]
MAIRLALVNDYEVVVRGLADMLRSYTDAFDVVELDAALPVQQPVDIALYDTFAQPQGDGDRVKELLANPRVRHLVVYSWNLQELLTTATMQRGVAGYLSKSLTAAELTSALEAVARGETVISPDPGRSAVIGGDWPGREEGLTAREAEVLALITQGMSNADIALRTSLSINSIKSYIRSCYRKIGAVSRSQAVLWGATHGFLPDRVRVSEPDISGS